MYSEEFITNKAEIMPLDEFRNSQLEKKRIENQIIIDSLEVENKELRLKVETKRSEFRATNGKPNQVNILLMQNIHHLYNRIIKNLCKINELKNFDSNDSENLVI
jgi:hypothetical protein